MKIKYYILLILLPLFVSCSKEPGNKPQDNDFKVGGVFIINEGNYSSANSSLSYYDPVNDIISQNIFFIANNAPLGDVAQSITFHNDIAYITINNSGHIYAINCKDAVFEGKIDNLISPRNMLIISNEKAYVSDLYSKNITIVNPGNYEITGYVGIGKSSEAMVKSGNKVFVSNWSDYNQTTSNNTVMVIDSETDLLIDSILVGIEPESMVIDMKNYLWVLCSGGFMNEETPTLWKINTETYNIESKFTFDNIQSNPTDLCISNALDELFFLNNGVFSMPINSTELPQQPIIESNENNYYSLGISKDGEIYVSDALDYNRNGIIYRFGNSGELISSFNAGIIPGRFGFYN